MGTKPIRLALLGDPVSHSRSPAIHRTALRAVGLEGSYEVVNADEDDLARSIQELREGKLTGINVTMPLKAVAALMADELTDLARAADSVNTLRCRDRSVEAHSTDSVAFQELFADTDRFPSDAPLLILGAGGSARAGIVAAENREVYISARSSAKAQRLVTAFDATGALEWGEEVDGGVVINATPLGMRGERLPEAVIRAAAALIDLPYGSEATPTIVDAAVADLPHADGVEFLCRQARASFEWWTGSSLDLEHLFRAARNV